MKDERDDTDLFYVFQAYGTIFVRFQECELNFKIALFIYRQCL